MDGNGIGKLELKRHNRTGILKLLHYYGPMSRVDISQKLSLTRAAVTIITNEMIEQGILYEKGEQKRSLECRTRGRKRILLDIQENYKLSLGAVIDGQSLYIGLANLKGQTLDKREVTIGGDSLRGLVECIYTQAEEIRRENGLKNSNLIGIGVCLSYQTLQLFGQADWQACLTELQKLLQMCFKIPVAVDGTTESLAVAELLFGAHLRQKPMNMVFVRYGNDVDAAVIMNDQVYRGTRNHAGWFAHIVVDAEGERCVCGKNGCCNTKMSIPRIMDKIKELYKQEKTTNLMEVTKGNVNKIESAIKEGNSLILKDKDIRLLYEEALIYLTAALDNLLTVLDPDKIVLYDFVFEKMLDLSALLSNMQKKHDWAMKDRIVLSSISSTNLHLAGNGHCVNTFFIERGG